MTLVASPERTPTPVRAALILLGLIDAVVGLWALFFPRAFYDSFPGGPVQWIHPLGPYSAHLVTDVGGGYLALLALLALAAWNGQRATIQIALVASLVQAVPHLIWHVGHLDMLDTLNATTLVVGLAVAVVVPAGALALTRRPFPTSTPDPEQPTSRRNFRG